MPEFMSRNKAARKAALRASMLAVCDPDIRARFADDWYLMEPLLMQMIRELQALRGIVPGALPPMLREADDDENEPEEHTAS